MSPHNGCQHHRSIVITVCPAVFDRGVRAATRPVSFGCGPAKPGEERVADIPASRARSASDHAEMNRIARILEAVVFSSRWLVMPFLLGLIIGLAALVYKFILKLADFIIAMPSAAPADVIVGILTLVDLTLTANLIVIVICSSYENFLARIDPVTHPDWPEGLVRIGFSDLKQKLLGSIAAIAGR
jgi:uncharacterized protein (TIGR00645 family)